MSKVVEIASKEIGQGETPINSNKTKYGKWFGLDGMAWCGMFVSWCYAQRGAPLPNIGFKKGYAGCQTAVAYFRKHNRVTTTPVAGNIVFFDWNADGRFDHTGIFVKWIEIGKTFESIEGNTAVGNDSNGGNVMLRTRKNINVLFVDPF
jgi:hypothetical protein